MAYVYNGDGYRAGGAGVDADLEMRRLWAQSQANQMQANAGLPTSGQIDTARGDLRGSLDRYNNLADNGMYSAADQSAILSSRVQAVNNATGAMQRNFNAQQSQRGLGANAGANMAAGMAGQFNAAGQRGQAYGDIMSENAQSKIAGIQGGAGVAGQMAQYAAMPVQQDMGDQYGEMYNKWRNAQVGYDGAKWGTTPQTPSYYGTPAYGGNTSAAPKGIGVPASSFTKKKASYIY